MDVAVGWLKAQTVKWVPDREQLLGTAFDVAGRVYLRQKTFSYEHFARGQENRVTRLFLGLPVAGRSQVDAAFDKLNKPLINCRQVTGVARKMLRSATSPAERCYHLHTLAMCASLTGRYGPAISDARRCADEAHGAGLAAWQLNGLLLLFRSLARHGRKVEALYALDEAEGVARPGDMHDVLDFIEECRRVLDEPEDERSPQHIEMAREEGLLKMMRKVGLVLRAQKVVKRLRSLPFADRVSLPEGFDPASKVV
ncbi:uncharacterized protein LOC134535360 [Bacillus rossius redtenbacheri]|uniref:uncharacterized protein LOC134535360 n=1 Tax=Bacillus rossius redtenbacheri TaxID=93214 RepID=UPI002FDE697E